MEEANFLKIRNNLGEILDRLNDKGEPIYISKGRKIRAVLITPEQFKRRFLDWQTREEKMRFLDGVKRLKKGTLNSLTVLRQVRGYRFIDNVFRYTDLLG
ncbi:MAG: type II toxin-antitoxin system Phd/YefM family antitoxin [Deltaproteobacteria bacterium]|nr:type II toxin-antitoxin system Phd/YefM family antitoxin [Deltaproteobacteria bacterium]MBW2344504.1 type II toxin-antitoxin system Phd/YefM family antitoxin [Deltaproteobacteria bacterium]